MLLTVACVQFRATECVEDNLTRIATLMSQSSKQGAKVVVFPEVSLCKGSIGQLHHSAESRQGQYIKQLCDLAHQYSVHVFIGLVEREKSKFYKSEYKN